MSDLRAFTDRKTLCRWCASRLGVGIFNDLFCCPLAQPSSECLWCGDDLAPGKGKSFCDGACSHEYHADMAGALARSAKTPASKTTSRRRKPKPPRADRPNEQAGACGS